MTEAEPFLTALPFTAAGFAIGLYLEHLEEASFLYDQRLVLLDDAELTWLDLRDFEDRFEAHIDALVVGEDLALKVCQQQAIEGESGELHAAIRVFCRQDRYDLVLEVVDPIDPDDEEKMCAVCDAFNHEMPGTWLNRMLVLFGRGNPKHDRMIASVIGYRRMAMGPQMVELMPMSTAIATHLWALGRIREVSVQDVLLKDYLHRKDSALQSAVALALLRIGEQKVVSYCEGQARTTQWPRILIGLSGSRNTGRILLEVAQSEEVDRDCIIALGLLGDIVAAPLLHSMLINEELGEAAAIAMNLLTGAELYEEIMVPDEVDEDELFDDERSGGQPADVASGTKVRRLSRDPEVWSKWWGENKSNFNLAMRYRNGKLFSPAVLIESLVSEKSSRLIRGFAYEELVIRYRLDSPIETDMFVSAQIPSLARYHEWIEANPSRFEEGKWYFAGGQV